MTKRKQLLGEGSSRPVAPLLSAARAEAELAQHGYVGLEHLLIALTGPDAPATSRLLASQGITTLRARDAVLVVVGSGRGDGPRFGPATLLATLSIDLDEIRRNVDAQFGPGAIHRLYASDVGWNLRPRGPLCDLGLSPQLKRAIHRVLGDCWDAAPPQLHEHLLLSALDSNSPAVVAVLDALRTPLGELRLAIAAQLPLAAS
jgi:hypothetical protein